MTACGPRCSLVANESVRGGPYPGLHRSFVRCEWTDRTRRAVEAGGWIEFVRSERTHDELDREAPTIPVSYA